jgi:hypothetical protein
VSRRLATAALVLAVSVASVSAREPKRQRVEPGSVPAWVRDAVARRAPETEAAAVWLQKEKVVRPLAAGGVRVSERWAVKILAPRALDVAEECTVDYRSLDKVETLSAWTVLPSGEVWIPDPVRDVRDDPTTWGYEMADGVRIRRIAPPRVAVGGIVACESVVVSSLDAGATGEYFGAADEPTVYQRFALEVPAGWGKEVVPRQVNGLEVREDAGSLAIVGADLKPLASEEHRPPAHAILPRVWLRWWSPDGARGFKDWNAVARWNDELTSAISKEHGGADAIAARLEPNDPSGLLAALEKAFEFASRDVRYVAIELGIGGWKPHAPAAVVERRFGDCKDKAFLLKAILENWGMASYPVDVRTTVLGPMDPNVPTFSQFNHVILAVPLPPGIGDGFWSTREVPGLGRLAFLDATAGNQSPWTLREDVQGTKAVVYSKSEAFLVDIPSAPPSASRGASEVTLVVDEEAGITKGTSKDAWFGMAAAEMRSFLAPMSDDERRKAWTRLMQSRFPGSTIGLAGVEGLNEALDRIETTTTIAAGHCGRRVESMLILEPGRAASDAVDVALAASSRRYALDLGHAREGRTVVHVALPPGWLPEDLPKPVVAAGDLFSGEASWSFVEGSLTYATTATLKVASIPPERYAEFRSAVGRLRAADATGIVFVRKP